jgi:hypothetical protein
VFLLSLLVFQDAFGALSDRAMQTL